VLLDEFSKKHGGPGTMSRSCTSSTSVGDCNLTVQGMDGVLCHNGGQHDQVPAVEGDASPELLAEKIEKVREGEDVAPCRAQDRGAPAPGRRWIRVGVLCRNNPYHHPAMSCMEQNGDTRYIPAADQSSSENS